MTRTMAQKVENVRDANAFASDAGLASALAWLKGDAIQRIHLGMMPRLCAEINFEFVTRADIIAVAQKYLRPEAVVTAVVRPG